MRLRHRMLKRKIPMLVASAKYYNRINPYPKTHSKSPTVRSHLWWPGMNWRGHVIFLAASTNYQPSSFGLIKDNMELSRIHYAVPHDCCFRKDCNTFWTKILLASYMRSKPFTRQFDWWGDLINLKTNKGQSLSEPVACLKKRVTICFNDTKLHRLSGRLSYKSTILRMLEVLDLSANPSKISKYLVRQ